MADDQYTIALLGQPNSGKSTLFNGLTGSRQHVGNWPGKTVEKKEGSFSYDGTNYNIVDLPGTYSLVANSDEEIVTRDYIQNGHADMVCILADASQLERSLFMLSDYAGIRVPAVLLLNLMDVAAEQGKKIDCRAISEQIGIPVIPFIASEPKKYEGFYELLQRKDKQNWIIQENGLEKLLRERLGDTYPKLMDILPDRGVLVYSRTWIIMKALEQDKELYRVLDEQIGAGRRQELQQICESVTDGSLITGDCKYKWIDSVLQKHVEGGKSAPVRGKFDKLATSKIWGKPFAIVMVLLGLMVSMIAAMPIMGIGSLIGGLSTPLTSLMMKADVAPILISLVSDGIITAVSFAVMMSGFAFGISLVFGFMEEVGYMARISYVFDGTMQKLGLQGKAIMPFLVSFGCNIGGGSGTRVLDSWGQRMLTIALSWVIPCGSTWGVVGLVSALFFGKGAVLVVLALFLTSILHIYVTSKIYGRKLLKESDRSGLLMELPPYHKPKWGSLLKYVWNRMLDVLKRAMGIIMLVSIVFCILSFTPSGNIEGSLIYKIGSFIEPVTMFFGLRWQTFMAWLASGMEKEASLGVLAALFKDTGIWTGIANQASVDTSILSTALIETISKAEALAFVFAFYFNMPCLMALGAASQETHSLKWTVRIALYYIGTSLILACIVYHIGLLLF
ncbi:MAG: ferrous iron transport protein B [Clostridia bacterium]|nr:ferrous iron transport protein B [Clostridia bacterium]